MLKPVIITFDKFASPSRQGEDVYELYYCKEHSPHGNAFSMTKEEFFQVASAIADYFKLGEDEKDPAKFLPPNQTLSCLDTRLQSYRKG